MLNCARETLNNTHFKCQLAHKKGLFSHLIQLVEVGRHEADQLTGADLIQDSAGQLQRL